MIDRQALHAEELSFVHPATGELMTFKAPLPGRFQGGPGFPENGVSARRRTGETTTCASNPARRTESSFSTSRESSWEAPTPKRSRARSHKLLEKGHKKVVVNLHGVDWINSTGMGILISGYTTMRRSGGDLRLLHVSDKIQSILYVTKLNLIFKCFDSEDEAVASFPRRLIRNRIPARRQ